MRNIAIFCKTLLKGGTEKQALILSKLLADNNEAVILINWSSNKIDQENLGFITKNSIKHIALKGNPFSKFFQFVKIIREERISFILSYLTLPNVVSGLSKLFAGNIIRIGGIRNEKLPYYKFCFERWIHNRLNDATVFNNFSAKEKFIKRGFKSNKVYVIQNAISTINTEGAERSKRSEIKIVTVSRFVKQKDFRTALYSFSKLVSKKKNKKLTYFLVGYGPMERKIKTLSEDLKILGRIKLLINPGNISGILSDCDIYLSTSLFEGLSNSIMEAMAAGLPVVATDVGDNKYLVRDGYNGFIIPLKDIDKIVEKLELLAESEDLRNDFGNKSRLIIKNNFTSEKLLDNYLNLFKEFQHS